MKEFNTEERRIINEIIKLLNATDIVWNSFILDDDGKYKIMRKSSNFGDRVFFEAETLEDLYKEINTALITQRFPDDDIKERIYELIGSDLVDIKIKKIEY